MIKIKIPISKNIKKNQKHSIKKFKLSLLRDFNESILCFSKTKGYISIRQLLAIKLLLKKNKYVKGFFKIIMPVLYSYNSSKKSERSRMGRGKGKPTPYWFISITSGTLLFIFILIKKLTFNNVNKILIKLNKKLSIKVIFKFYNKI